MAAAKAALLWPFRMRSEFPHASSALAKSSVILRCSIGRRTSKTCCEPRSSVLTEVDRLANVQGLLSAPEQSRTAKTVEIHGWIIFLQGGLLLLFPISWQGSCILAR